MSQMKHVTPGERPDNDAGYLEMMTKIIFMGGLSRQVVESKWDGFLDAFAGFDPATVADFTEEDVERLSEDERIVRYTRKIEAVVANARRMVEIANEEGSFGGWVQETAEEKGIPGTAKLLAKEFKYMSEDGSRNYLFAVGEDVKVSDEIAAKYGAA